MGLLFPQHDDVSRIRKRISRSSINDFELVGHLSKLSQIVQNRVSAKRVREIAGRLIKTRGKLILVVKRIEDKREKKILGDTRSSDDFLF